MTTLTLKDPELPAPARPKPTATVRLAGWSLRHPLLAIGGWVVMVLLCVFGGNLAGMVQATDAQLAPGETGRAAAMITSAGLAGHDVESILITPKRGPADRRLLGDGTAPWRRDLAGALRVVPWVAGVAEAVPAPDGSAMLVQVTLKDGVDDPAPLLAAVAGVAGQNPDLRMEATGSLSIDADVNRQLSDDFSTALVRSLPITIVILLLAFGALLAAGVPVLLGVSCVLSAVGLYTVTSHVIPDGGRAAEMILLIGMAVGVDYSLFYLKREREERKLGRTGQQALTIAAATAGHSVVTSGIAVIVAMAGLFLLGDVNFASMAVGAIIVVAIAVLGSLTVLPAILGLLGERVDRPRIPLLGRLTMSSRPARIWPMLLRPALKFPAATLLIGVAAMVVLALPATGLKLKNSTIVDLPQGLPSVAAYERLSAAFPDERSSLNVVVQGPAEQSRTVIRRLEAATANNPAFLGQPAVRSAADTTVVSIAVPFGEESSRAGESLRTLRATVVPKALAGTTDVEVAVGGSIAGNADYLDELSSGAPWVIGFVVLMTFLLMTLSFGSVVVGLVTIFANLLSAGAAFGVLVLVFQSQWGADLLGFHLTGAVIAWIPVFLFVILFGLSMDYHVLVISRIKEASDQGMPIRIAVREGVGRSASVITSAAAVMIGVFAIFAGLNMIEFKELGVGLAAAVLLDAVVVRILILPALMALLGKANWWAPARLRRDGRSRVTTNQPGSFSR